MSTYRIRKGRDIRLQGKASQQIVDVGLPKQVAVQPPDFRGLKFRLEAKQGMAVKAGTPLLSDKNNPKITVASPTSGTVAAINRGQKRALLEVVIETDGKKEAEQRKKFSTGDIQLLKREDVIDALLEGGMWPVIRQRPFSKVANPADEPKAIFVHAMSTEPLAPELDVVLERNADDFQTGLDIIGKLSKQKPHLCIAASSKSKVLSHAQNVNTHRFSGPHPTGNVSTHIHHVSPINKGDIVWYIEAQDVVRIARLFTQGVYSAERIVAITGEGAKNRVYAKTIMGAPLSALLQGSDLTKQRCISGSVLSGREVGPNGFLGYYDSQVTVIPQGGEREFLGWLKPGFNKYTFTRTYASAFLGDRDVSLTTDENGGHRAIVLNHLYDQYVPLDIMTYFLLRAVIANDIEEAEKLGILECDEEDFALCTFACPSKTDVGQIIRGGLDLIEREG